MVLVFVFLGPSSNFNWFLNETDRQNFRMRLHRKNLQPNENNNSSTLSGVGLCKVRLELFNKKINTQFNI
jgi:hypothetical protein